MGNILRLLRNSGANGLLNTIILQALRYVAVLGFQHNSKLFVMRCLLHVSLCLGLVNYVVVPITYT